MKTEFDETDISLWNVILFTNELYMSDYLFHVFLSYRKQRSYKPSSDLPVLWIEASKL